MVDKSIEEQRKLRRQERDRQRYAALSEEEKKARNQRINARTKAKLEADPELHAAYLQRIRERRQAMLQADPAKAAEERERRLKYYRERASQPGYYEQRNSRTREWYRKRKEARMAKVIKLPTKPPTAAAPAPLPVAMTTQLPTDIARFLSTVPNTQWNATFNKIGELVALVRTRPHPNANDPQDVA